MPMFGSSGGGFTKPPGINWGGGSLGQPRPPEQPNWGGGGYGQPRPMPQPGPFPMPRPMPYPGFQPPRYGPGGQIGFNDGIGVRPPMNGGYQPLPTFPMPRPIPYPVPTFPTPRTPQDMYQAIGFNPQMFRKWT